MTIAEERAAVVAEALTWIGTPFQHATRHKGVGVDCAQLLVAAFGELAEVDVPAYPPQWFLHENAERLTTAVSAFCTEVETPDLGDIILFTFGRTASHAGIVIELEPLRVVHAYRPGRAVQVNDVGPGTGLGTRRASCWRLSRWMEG